jgi:uncharacterized phage protein gp47/JayE
LNIPTVEELVADCVADQRALIDPLIDTDAEEALGQLNGIFCSRLRDAFEVILVAYNALDRGAVEGVRADTLAAMTGSKRQGATRSRFTGTRKLALHTEIGAVIPIGTVFEVDGDPTVQFETTEAITAASALEYVSAQCTREGRIACNALTLTVITTPIPGLLSVINTFDAILGTEADKDEELMRRSEDELYQLGSGRPDTIRSAVLAIEVDGLKPVLECNVLTNDTDSYSALGLPPKSMEVLVFDGIASDAEDDDIAQAIWDNKPGGTEMFGSVTGTALDTEGTSQVVKFSRTTIVGIDVEITAITDASFAVQALRDAWKAFVDALPIKTPAVQWMRAGAALVAVQGVVSISQIRLRRHGGSYLAANTDLTLDPREKATADATSGYVAVV